MIHTIIFDFGGVILKHKSTIVEDIISQIFAIPHDQAATIWKREKTSLLVGKITSTEFLEKLRNELNVSKPVSELLHVWENLYIKEAEDVDWNLLDFIEKLKSNYRVYLFTDTIDIHDKYNSTRGIYNRFHNVFKSYEEGIAKAEGKSAYEYLLKKIQAKPEECLFIDDLEFNIKTAREIGIQSIIFKNLA